MWRSFASVFTAAVVLLASLNCACAMPEASPKRGEATSSGAKHACCAQKNDRSSPTDVPSHDRQSSCRHCNPSFAAQVAAKQVMPGLALDRYTFLLADDFTARLTNVSLESFARDLSPPFAPQTLLALHCRLTT